MRQRGVNELSLTTHYLRMIPYGSDITMSTGTGFTYEYDSKYYLITNGHNVTRVNPETNERIVNTAAYPVKICTKVKIKQGDDYYLPKDLVDIDLYEDSDFKQPKWYVHPTHGYKVDVVAILIDEVKNVHESYKLFPMNKVKFDTDYWIEIADDVYILGYPFDINGGLELPIWKRGTVSSEPLIGIEGLPKLLVDTATRPGMSGSPVVMIRRGFHSLHDGDQLKGDEKIGTIRNFVGVYSGRIGAQDNLLAQLGVVWKSEVIDEILKAKVVGDIKFQSI